VIRFSLRPDLNVRWRHLDGAFARWPWLGRGRVPHAARRAARRRARGASV